MRFTRLVLATVLVMVAAPLRAQPVVLTVEDAVARALRESHRIAELRAREEAARASVTTRAAAARPQISAQAGYTRTNHVDEFGVPDPAGRLRVIYPDIPDNFRTRLDLAWPLYTGGRVESLTRAAREEAEAASRDLAALEADLRFEVTRAYWQAVTAADTVRVSVQALERTDAHLGDLRARLQAGLIPPNDVLTTEAQRARHEVALIEARNASELALAEVRRLIGLDAAAPVQLAAPLEQTEEPGTADLEAQIARAKALRPERAALLDRIASAEARIAAAGATKRPSVAVNGGLDYARPNPRILPRADAWQDSWDVSVNASWSLWDSGRRAGETAEAIAAARGLRARLAEFDTLVALEVRQRRLDLEAGRAAARAAADGVRSATEARRVVGERFAAGVATSTDVLDAQLALVEAELDRARALASVHIAAARLRRAVGE